MDIVIDYTSKWGNSFLSEPDNKGNRDYIASLSKMNSGSNKDNKLGFYKEKEISNVTAYGVLYRLLGARKPLVSLMDEDTSFVKTLIENEKITFSDIKSSSTDESIYLRNKSRSNDQNSFSGIPNEYILEIDDFKKAFSILFYSREEALGYILKDKFFIKEIEDMSILNISDRLNSIYKDKSLLVLEQEFDAINLINVSIFNKDIDKVKANILLIAINKAIKLLEKKYKSNENVSKFLTANFTLSGISLNGKSFTLKDFMKKFANSKIVYGNPYQTDFWVENEYNGKNKKFEKKVTKSNGQLIISIDCDYEQAKEIKEMITYAGVSSFYLGKKGLAYVKKIII